MKRNYLFKALSLLFGLTLIVSFISCKDDDHTPNPSGMTTIERVNSTILEYTYFSYLWEDKLPARSSFDVTRESDPIAFFKDKLRVNPPDRWSYVTDEAAKLFGDYVGTATTYGYSLSLGEITNTGNYFAVVDFVYPDSPAEKARLLRGDIIVLMNEQDIYSGNYMDLFNSSSITLRMGEIVDNALKLTDRRISMQAIEMTLTPVNTYKVINKGDKRIGYVCYTDFIYKSEKKLAEAFTEIKSERVTDIVLDLRYNRGGADSTAQYLASILVPEAMIDNKENYFLRNLWNDEYMDYYKQIGKDMNSYFLDAKVNMGLQEDSKLYILTSQNTASASEAVIVGLMPYLDIVLIGEGTHGKYCGAALIQFGKDSNGNITDKELTDWAMSLVVLKFANKDGFTDFSGGIAPDYDLSEDWKNLLPFGDENDPLLAKAIELITGVPAPRKLHTRTLDSSYQLLQNLKSISPLKGGMNKVMNEKGIIN